MSGLTKKLGPVEWLICVIASIGFAFDIYVILVLPLILGPALGELGAWVRLHYVYPYPHVDEVIPLMAAGKVLPYLDVPFQHASARILRAMKRGSSPASSMRASQNTAALASLPRMLLMNADTTS